MSETTNEPSGQEIPERKNVEKSYTDPKTGKFAPGNPGKPKGARHLTTLVRDALKKMGKTKDGKEMSYEQALVEAILQKAIIDQDPTTIRLVWNYLDGMPNQNINLSGIDELRREYFTKLEALSREGDSENNLP